MRSVLARRPLGAFTLLELIVTIVILGILAAIAVPTFGAVVQRSQVRTAEATLGALHREARALAALDQREVPNADDYAAASADLSTSAASAGVYAADTVWPLYVPAVFSPAVDAPFPGRTEVQVTSRYPHVVFVGVGQGPAPGGTALKARQLSLDVKNGVVGVATATDRAACVLLVDDGSSVEVGKGVQTGNACSGTNAITRSLDPVPEPPVAPGAPVDLTAVEGDSEATISWAPSSRETRTALLGYTLTVNPTPSGGQPASLASDATSVKVTGLQNGRIYSFSLRANNAAGSSPSASSSVFLPVPFVAASAPRSFSAVPGDAQVSFSWVAPESAGYTVFTKYVLTLSHAGHADQVFEVPAEETTKVVTGLENATTYNASLVAVNVKGGSVAATTTVVLPDPTVPPGAPADVTVSPGNAQATVTWVAPTFTGNGTITAYQVSVSPSPSGGQPALVSGSVRFLVVAGLTNGSSYTFTVRAVNSAGAGQGTIRNVTIPVPWTPSTGVYSSLAGTSTTTGNVNAPGSGARFNGDVNAGTAITLGVDGNYYVADSGSFSIRKVTPQGDVSLFAGGSTGDRQGSAGVPAQFRSPRAITVAPGGGFYVAEECRIRRLSADGVVTSTVAGAGACGEANGTSGATSTFRPISDIAVGQDGTIFVAEPSTGRVRRVDPSTGATSVVVGGGSNDPTMATSRCGTDVRFTGLPKSLFVDSDGGLLLGTSTRVYKVDPVTRCALLVHGGGANDVARGQDGALYGITSGSAWRLSGSQTQQSEFAPRGGAGFVFRADGALVVFSGREVFILQ